MGEINYDQKTHEVQIAVHIFIDDFESALVKSGSTKLYLCTPKEDQSTDDAIEKYLNNKMKVFIGQLFYQGIIKDLHGVQRFPSGSVHDLVPAGSTRCHYDHLTSRLPDFRE